MEDNNGTLDRRPPMRTDYIAYISEEQFFMDVACRSAMRSRNPYSQIGACIVTSDGKIVSTGFNNVNREPPTFHAKYHAEYYAIRNKNSNDLKDCTMYVTLFPCYQCAKLIIGSGIKRIIYLRDKAIQYCGNEWTFSKKILKEANVDYRPYSEQFIYYLPYRNF